MLNPIPRISAYFLVSLLCATSLLASRTLATEAIGATEATEATEDDLRIENTAQLRYAVGGLYFGALSNPTILSRDNLESRFAERRDVAAGASFVRTTATLPVAPRTRVAAQPAFRAAVGTIRLSLVKSQEVFDADGDPVLAPGSIIRYRIEISGTGTGTATAIVMTDPVPARTTYVANSIQLNGEPLTDAADEDGAQILAGTPDVVQVAVGKISEAGGPQIVEFEVLID